MGIYHHSYINEFSILKFKNMESTGLLTPAMQVCQVKSGGAPDFSVSFAMN